MNKVAELAAKTVVCPGCGGKGQVAYPWFAPCPTCKGKGQVALIAGLQVPPQYGDVRAWTVVDEAIAFLAMVQWCIARGWPVTFECAVEDLPAEVVVQAEDTRGVAEGNDANALADAILQVAEEEECRSLI